MLENSPQKQSQEQPEKPKKLIYSREELLRYNNKATPLSNLDIDAKFKENSPLLARKNKKPG